MKKCLLMLTGAAVLLSLSSAACAAVGRPYLSINVGMAVPEDSDSNMDGQSVTLESDAGPALTGALGYDFGSLRLEGELSYQKNDLDKVLVHEFGLAADASGDTTSLAGMVNGYFQFLNPSPFTPFLTAGIGYAKIEVNDFAVLGENLGGDDGTSVAYQVGAGCSYAVNPMMSVDVQYRYANAPDLQLDLEGYGQEQDVECASHNIYGGLRFAF